MVYYFLLQSTRKYLCKSDRISLPVAEYQEVFGIFDNRGDGKVPVSLIGELLRACGQNPTEAEWKKLVGDDPGMLETY